MDSAAARKKNPLSGPASHELKQQNHPSGGPGSTLENPREPDVAGTQ